MDIREMIQARIENLRALVEDNLTFDVHRMGALSEQVIQTFINGGRLAFVGNGGSAAEAMHLAAEFTGRCVLDHEPLPALCLNESQSALTAIANDYGLDQMFARQASALLTSKDMIIALSTSGKSINIIKCLETCVQKGMKSFLWTGESSPEFPGVELYRVPSNSTPRIQEVHLAWGHILAESVEFFFRAT